MKIKIDRVLFTRWVLGAAMIFLLATCKDDEVTPTTNTTTSDENSYVNNWILENMNFWYLWHDKIPASPDLTLAPEEFFNSLLSSEDRFSWIQADYQELLNSLQGVSKEAGYEYKLYRESSSNSNVIAQIVYIKPASAAAQAGLKRGDVITAINEQQITISNYQTLLGAISENHTVRYRPLLIDQEQFGTETTLSLTTTEYQEDPNYMHTVIESDNHKVGYYVYNFFATGADSESTTYDDEMESVFADFKAQGITDLVLDLRYNSGGSETSANNLASLIGTGVNTSSIFLKREYNDDVEEEIINTPSMGEAYLTSYYQAKTSNVGNQLQNSRLYVLTSSRTASASELVINALKPYMEVFVIGDTTYGKNVGSISLYEENDSKNTWGMQPIVLKVYNSLNQSDYASGFVPDIYNADNSTLLYPLGDTRETLLSLAMEQITGLASSGRKGEKETKEFIGSSLDRKARGFTLTVDGIDVKKILLH
ncbi:S41 family peptidase [Ohtaekwangia koreensis]|nr:S41 family peptidase [Ohtaekwangia koreensis]